MSDEDKRIEKYQMLAKILWIREQGVRIDGLGGCSVAEWMVAVSNNENEEVHSGSEDYDFQRLRHPLDDGILTPYQGPDRVFGRFQCPECFEKWTSANSWANRGQRCMLCDNLVYPHQQKPLDSRLKKEERPPHQIDLCEKCEELGHSCVPHRFDHLSTLE